MTVPPRLRSRLWSEGLQLVFISSTVARARHFGTIFGLIQAPGSASRAKLAIAVCCSDACVVVAPGKKFSHMAFFHFSERIPPSNRGIKHLGVMVPLNIIQAMGRLSGPVERLTKNDSRISRHL